MKITIQNVLTGALLICVSILFYFQFSQKENLNIGFVRSQELVYQFDGMVDAMAKFEKEQEEWARNIDTLKSDYEKSIATYNAVRPSLTDTEAIQHENLLQHQYNNLLKYSREMEASLNEREAEILEGVLNQVNAFSEEFAEQKGLDLIITTAISGTILYGSEGMDYTEELLEHINEKYKG